MREVPESLLFIRHLDGDWFVGWGKATRMPQAPLDRPAFYLPDFFLTDPDPWWITKEFRRMTTAELTMTWPKLKVEVPTGRWSWQEPSETEFSSELNELLGTIDRGWLKKAVPIVMAASPKVPTDEEKMALWRKTIDVPARWIAYGGWWDHEGLIGLSPEYLFLSTPDSIESMALAGTFPHPGPQLLECEKSVREHELVVDDLRTQLGRFGKVQETPTREWVLGSLKHLRTDLNVEGTSPSFMELVEALHPTPALGGCPRHLGTEWLKTAHYANTRRRFGAPFGVNVPGELALCAVAIRNIQWHDGQTWQASGCGVVAGSDVHKEWDELSLKRRVVREQFGLL
jgi:menaquinone-specific isochorismate synthase